MVRRAPGRSGCCRGPRRPPLLRAGASRRCGLRWRGASCARVSASGGCAQQRARRGAHSGSSTRARRQTAPGRSLAPGTPRGACCTRGALVSPLALAPRPQPRPQAPPRPRRTAAAGAGTAQRAAAAAPRPRPPAAPGAHPPAVQAPCDERCGARTRSQSAPDVRLPLLRTMVVLSKAHSCSSQARVSSHGAPCISAPWGGRGPASSRAENMSQGAEPKAAVHTGGTPDIARRRGRSSGWGRGASAGR